MKIMKIKIQSRAIHDKNLKDIARKIDSNKVQKLKMEFISSRSLLFEKFSQTTD